MPTASRPEAKILIYCILSDSKRLQTFIKDSKRLKSAISEVLAYICDHASLT